MGIYDLIAKGLGVNTKPHYEVTVYPEGRWTVELVTPQHLRADHVRKVDAGVVPRYIASGSSPQDEAERRAREAIALDKKVIENRRKAALNREAKTRRFSVDA